MKLANREPTNLRKQQYSSRLMSQQNTSTSRTIQRKGHSVEPTSRDGNIYYSNPASNEYDLMALNSLITQSAKASSGPQFNSNDFSKQNLIAQINVNSPKQNTERLSYSVTNRNLNKSIQKFLPPKSKNNHNKKTLVLDLDETLVHSSFKPFSLPSDIILKIEFENKIHEINVLVRPGVEEFLERMAKHYELVIFTASLSKYADPLVDRIDSKRLCFFRLFREHCTIINKSFVKDLRLLDRDMKDNNPFSYALNVDNGFPIKNWFDDKKDRELFNISPILEFLAYVPDIRDFIKKMSDNNEISYPKAISILNSYKASRENLHKSNTDNQISIPIKNYGTPTIKNVKDYSYKILKDERSENYMSSSHNIKRIPTNNSQILRLDERNIPKYSSNMKSEKDKPQILENNSNNNSSRNVSNQNEMINSYNLLNNKNNLKTEQEKQNINIKIINNNINNYIVNPNEKKIKAINTFRNSNSNPINQSQNNMEKSHNINIITRSNNNFDLLKTSQQGPSKGANPKSLNLNLEHSASNENTTNLLKNSQITKGTLSKTVNPQAQIHPNVKYSSLIDYKTKYNTNNYHYSNYNNNSVRPSSAIILKGKHIRDQSTHSNKNENIYSSINRSPSTKNLINAKTGGTNNSTNYLSSYDSMIISKETPKRTGVDHIIPNRISQGSKSVRSTSHQDKVRYSYNNDINQWKPGRYENEDSVTARGYYFSSRASDIKNNYLANPMQSVNYSTSKYSAAALAGSRSNSQIKMK